MKKRILTFVLKTFFKDNNGYIDLSDLDFRGYNVSFSLVKADYISNSDQQAKTISNGGQESKYIFNDYQKADSISNKHQESIVIDNDNQKLKK